MSDASDDLNRSFDFDEHEEAQHAFAQELFAARNAAGGFLGAHSDDGDEDEHERGHGDDDADGSGSAAGAARGNTSTSRTNASRLLEALEALSQDGGGDGDGIPPSLRGTYLRLTRGGSLGFHFDMSCCVFFSAGLLGQLNGGSDAAVRIKCRAGCALRLYPCANVRAIGIVLQVMGGLFPFAQLLEGSGGGSRFQRTLEAISAQSPTHVQMVRLVCILAAVPLEYACSRVCLFDSRGFRSCWKPCRCRRRKCL